MEKPSFSEIYKKYFIPPKGSLKKYRGLIILMAAFLVLTIGLLIINVWTNSQTLTHSRIVETATRQNLLLQQISKNIIDVDLSLRASASSEAIPVAEVSAPASAPATISSGQLSADAKKQIDEIQQYSVKFENNLRAFEEGGIVTTPEGLMIPITKHASDDLVHKHIDKIRQDWRNYHQLIGQFMLEYQAGKVNPKQVGDLVNHSRQFNQTLLNNGNEHIFALYSDMQQRVYTWQAIQWAGIAMAILLFAVIVFGAMRRLMNDDFVLNDENSELNEIMSAIREGLFLIEKDFTIGKQHSAALVNMLEQDDIAGKNLFDVIAKILPESELETTKMFIEQLYNPWVVEELMGDLNPLQRITMLSKQTNTAKYLDFKFFRVVKNDKVERILVSVVDSTENVLLQSSIQAQEEQEQRELEMLNTILHVDSRVLNNFIHSSQERLDEINEILQSPETGLQELKAKANFVGRNIHSLKGEASAMNLTRMVDICSTIEDSLAILRHQTQLSGQDFFSVIILIDDLYRLLDILDDYSRRLDAPNVREEQTDEGQLELQQLQHFAQDIAERNEKKVSLLMNGFYDYAMDEHQRDSIRQIMKQLLRNAVVHGIEAPAVRRKRNKSETGSLKFILTATSDGNLNLLAEDDGNGIDFEAIRKKAVADGKYTEDEVGQLSKKQLLGLMVSDGFSTASTVTEDAGKGIGMGVVRQTIHKMGGKLNINTAYQQYTRFNITFPPQQP